MPYAGLKLPLGVDQCNGDFQQLYKVVTNRCVTLGSPLTQGVVTTSRKLEPDQERWWLGKTILFALFFGIALLVLGHWITVLQSRNVYVAAAITGVMAWAVLTTFRRDWRNAGFWVICALLLVMHGALMWVLVISRLTRVERNDALSIAIPEGVVMMLILVVARAKNYFAP